jgi:putative two-component system hydrogenase maturation factor HypX/HoxX
MLDPAFGTDADADAAGFRAQARSRAERLAYDPALDRRLEEKRRGRATDEQVKPLRAYRREERAQSHRSFFGPDRGYHDARRRFTHKLGTACGASDRPVVADPVAAAGAQRAG